jgi:hypothetical protein
VKVSPLAAALRARTGTPRLPRATVRAAGLLGARAMLRAPSTVRGSPSTGAPSACGSGPLGARATTEVPDGIETAKVWPATGVVVRS